MKTERLLPEKIIFALLTVLLPTQLGKHFWPDFALLSGIRIDYLSPTLYLTDCLILLLFGCFSVRFFREHKSKYITPLSRFLRKTSPFWFTTIFLLIGVLSSGFIDTGIYALLKFVELALLAFYITYNFGRTFTFKSIVSWLSIATIYESVLSVGQFINQGSIGGLLYFLGERTFSGTTPGIANASVDGTLILRPYGTFSHPNVLAGFLLAIMLMDVFMITKVKMRKLAVLYFFSIVMGSIALLLSLSRVAILFWVCFLLGLLFRRLWVVFTGRRDRIFCIAITVLALGLLSFTFSKSALAGRFLQTSLFDESVVEREILLRSAWEMFLSSPIFGLGIGNFLPDLMRYPLIGVLYTALQPVHNIFLLVLAESGIIGIWMFVQLFYVGFKNSIAHIRLKKELPMYTSLFFVLMAIVVLGNFDHYWLTLQQGQLLFCYIVALAAVKIVK